MMTEAGTQIHGRDGAGRPVFFKAGGLRLPISTAVGHGKKTDCWINGFLDCWIPAYPVARRK
jgi:hypothetical protein